MIQEVFVVNPSTGGSTSAVSGAIVNSNVFVKGAVVGDTPLQLGYLSSGDVAAPTSGNAIITYPGFSGKANYITGVAWSYNGTPTSGNLTIADGATTIFNLDITAAGPGFIPFPYPKKGSISGGMTVTLQTISGILAKVDVLNHFTNP